jgi:zinc transporter ZupT
MLSEYLMQALQASTTEPDLTHKINPGKFAAIPIIFLIIFGACLLPHLLIRLKRGVGLIIALCTCLSGGALLGIGLMHILPHADEYWEIYLIPEGCGDSHAGHDHFELPEVEIFTSNEYLDDFDAFSAVLIASNNNNNNNNNSTLTLSPHEYLPSSLTPLQSIDPVDPSTIPDPAAVEPNCPEGHLFPWGPLCCGLVIMLLMATESFLHTYLSGRGPGAVHLHEHGDGGACEHGHDHHHHHHHDHDQHPQHHKDGTHCDGGDCDEEIIELSPTPTHNQTTPINDVESPSSPTTQSQPGNNNSFPTSSGDHPHTHGEQSNDVEPVDEAIKNDTEFQRRTREIVEEGDVDIHGHKLSQEEQNRLRYRRTIDAYISALAISLHCVFNGLSLGVYTASTQSDVSSFWTLFGATVGHKLVDGFAVGIPLMRANLGLITTLVIAVLVASSTPIGILIGYFASNVKSDGRYLAQAILMSLSSGSFFYIALIEMIPNGVKGHDFVWLKWLCVGIGFALSALIGKWA